MKLSLAYILLNICFFKETDGTIYKTILCAVYTDVSSVEIKTEADSNDVMECRHDDMPSTGMSIVSLRCDMLYVRFFDSEFSVIVCLLNCVCVLQCFCCCCFNIFS